MKKFCDGPYRKEQCIACPLPEGDEQSLVAVNAIMNALDPNTLSKRDLQAWIGQICTGLPGSSPTIVSDTILQISAGNCTNY